MKIGIFGISGSGKTTTAKKIQNKIPTIIAESASNLIQKSFDISKILEEDVSIVQQQLLKEYDAFTNLNQHSILECHNIIESTVDFIEIDDFLIRKFHFHIVFFIYTDPKKILKRRLVCSSKKNRAIISEDEILRRQNFSLFKCLKEHPELHLLYGSQAHNFAIDQINQFLKSDLD